MSFESDIATLTDPLAVACMALEVITQPTPEPMTGDLLALRSNLIANVAISRIRAIAGLEADQ